MARPDRPIATWTTEELLAWSWHLREESELLRGRLEGVDVAAVSRRSAELHEVAADLHARIDVLRERVRALGGGVRVSY